MTRLRRIQIYTVFAHSLVVLWAAATVGANAGKAMYQAPWFILFFPDLPATIALVLAWIMLPDAWFEWGVRNDIDISSLWLPLLLYGGIGGWWWWKISAWIAATGKQKKPGQA